MVAAPIYKISTTPEILPGNPPPRAIVCFGPPMGNPWWLRLIRLSRGFEHVFLVAQPPGGTHCIKFEVIRGAKDIHCWPNDLTRCAEAYKAAGYRVLYVYGSFILGRSRANRPLTCVSYTLSVMGLTPSWRKLVVTPRRLYSYLLKIGQC